VDCGEVEPTVCDEVWRAEAAQELGLTALLPVTSVEVDVSHRAAWYCYDVMIERWIIRKYTTQLCGL
jgi:hypothetical protein